MAELKTKLTEENIIKFLTTFEDEEKRIDSLGIVKIMQEVTGLQPKMWGTSIVGFGSYHYKYESGHEGDMCIVGFSPRKQNFSLYLKLGGSNVEDLLENLGKYKTGKGCLYIKKLSDINIDVLKKIIKISFEETKKKHS